MDRTIPKNASNSDSIKIQFINKLHQILFEAPRNTWIKDNFQKLQKTVVLSELYDHNAAKISLRSNIRV